jgi:CysZ protein
MSARSAPARPGRGLVAGAGYALRGVPFVLARPGLLLLALVPLLINLALLVGLYGVGLRFYDDALALAFPWARPEAWYAVFWWVAYGLIRVLLYVALLVVTLLLVVALGSIIAAPFHDALSERTERAVGGRGLEAPLSLAGVVGDVLRASRDQLALLGVYLLGLVGIVLLNLVPVAGTLVSSALSFVWTCWFFALEFTDGALARSGLGWSGRWRLLRTHLRLSLGFGIGAWVMLLIPLTMPFLVVSGTLLACDLLRRPDPGGASPAGAAAPADPAKA